MNYRVEVFSEGEWVGNGLVFATREEADEYGDDLLCRWFVPEKYRVVETNKPVNYRWNGLKAVSIA